MTRTDKFILAALLGLLLMQGCANFSILSGIREVQLASAKAQMSGGKLDVEMSKTLMRIDSNMRKGN